jgi:DNA-binding response OmpR family regulator
MALIKILVVDDDEVVRVALAAMLETYDFEVTMADSVSSALKLISSNPYDVLLSDLHMPGAGDGLTVVSAMRHAHPDAVTMLLSSFPEMDAAAQAILLQADQILVKPMDIKALVEAIHHRVKSGNTPTRVIETVATILERSIPTTIEAWLMRVRKDEKLMAISLNDEERTGHLAKVLTDLVTRLRSFKALGSTELVSTAAHEHGKLRRRQCYTAAMVVEESRMLKVSVFETLQRNIASIDFSLLLEGVMTIADEVDSQLSQAMDSYINESVVDQLPA